MAGGCYETTRGKPVGSVGYFTERVRDPHLLFNAHFERGRLCETVPQL